MDQQFACGRGHQVKAFQSDDEPAILTGHLCPLCLGAVVGHGDMIDSRILAPVRRSLGSQIYNPLSSILNESVPCLARQ